MKTSTIEFQVELEDTDAEGIVFYPRYFSWFDRATKALLKSIGLSHSQLLNQYHYTQPVTECGCQFIHTLHYDNPVRITTNIMEVQERYFKLRHVVYSGDLMVGSGYEIRAWVRIDQPDQDKRFVVVPIPDEIISKLSAFSEKYAVGKYSEYENIPN
jgi:acyl-CoA thioester hydrolase